MICALRSSFYRFFKTGLYLKMLIFTGIMCLCICFGICFESIFFYTIGRPRYIDNGYIRMCLIVALFILPFIIAVFSSVFTGSDISYRAINNKIATGLSRRSVYLADLIVTLVATLMIYLFYVLITFAVAKIWPLKSNIKIDNTIVNSLIIVLITCISFAAVFTLIQYFFCNKLFAIVVALLLLLSMPVVTGQLKSKLDIPYRYEVSDSESGESYWELNPKYIGGTGRKVIMAVYNSCAYNMDIGNLHTEQCVASGIIVVLATSAGLLSISKKEFS